MDSIWTKNADKPIFESLKGDIKTDVLIIGGGMAGILCAYMLKNACVDCVLVEANEICGGITKNTTAKITLQHGLIYDKMIRRFGIDTARLYLKAQTDAMRKYREICREVDCGYEEKDSFVYSQNADMIKKLEREELALNRLGCKAFFEQKLPLPISVLGAVKVERQAQFQPLKFAFAISEGLPIFEHTKVLEVCSDGVIKTNNGRISAKKIIVATHFPFLNKHGLYFLKMYQHRSYVLALDNAPNLKGMYVDASEKGMSFRNYNGMLLLGGGGHRTGKKGGGWRELENFARENYPSSNAVCKWATQDCMTLDGIAYIGRYSKNTNDLYVATGFNKWGMTLSMVSAMRLTDMILDKRSEYADVFSPSRSILRPQLAVNVFESAKGLLTPTVPRCSHMGCALKYNKQEHSWDCSCHGSRFTKNGDIIDNPATKGKRL
jgi:glycine/D-amino acid oxidase-like deaminating enzyme